MTPLDAAAASRFDDRLSRLEGRVEELARSFEQLRTAVSDLDRRGPRHAVELDDEETESGFAAGAPAVGALPGGFTLVGRTLIALGGAYLLRALTSAGLLPQLAGVVAAFLYALVWLWLADRDGGRERPASATFHGVTGALIGFPLLWEATGRFHYLSPTVAGVAVAAFAAAALAVALRRRLGGLAWAAGLGGAATAFALIVVTHAWPPFAVDLILLGVAGVGLAYAREWRGLGWMLAAVAHGALLLLMLIARVAPQRVGTSQAGVVALLVALCLAFLGCFAWRLLVARRELGAFEAVWSVAAVGVGYLGAAALVARSSGTPGAVVGLAGVALALACYTVAFAVIPRQERRKLLLASSLAVVLALASSGLLLAPTALAFCWASLAVVATTGAVRLRRVTLALHGTLFALASATASGLLRAALLAFAAPAGNAWPTLALPAYAALVAAAFCCLLPLPRPAPFWKLYAGATRLLQLAVFALVGGGTVLHLLAPSLVGNDAALLATARTVVLVVSALLLAWIARWPTVREAAWLVYPILVLTIVKLAVEDFPQGRPATLFVALALTGGAFIFAPRLLRRAAMKETTLPAATAGGS